MKILIIRTIQCDLLGLLLRSLPNEFPQADICLLDNKKQTSFLQAQKNIRRIYCTKEKDDYGFGNISIKTILEIRRQHYDSAIIPHKQFDINGFENVILLLTFFGIKNWLHCTIDWKLKRISKFYLFKIGLVQALALPLFLTLLPLVLCAFVYLFATEKIFKIKQTAGQPWKCGLEDIRVKDQI
ncbi:hypothetical protein HZB94_02935 [Candidatus Falkowbacteria bacterium]|nr:hypothetical protein [Candidatus Falkowbacteria bacterium]